MNKEESIKHAIKYHIESILSDKRSLAAKAASLKMDVSDLSRLLNLRTLPSLLRIMEIEKKLGVEILVVNLPIEEISLKILHEKKLLMEAEVVRSGVNVPKMKSTEQNEIGEKGLLYTQLLRDPIFKDNIKPLLKAIEDCFQPIVSNGNLKYVVRKKDQYISINLVGSKKSNDGYHIMFIRYYPKKPKLQLEFIVQNAQFKTQAEIISKLVIQSEREFPELKEGSTETANVPKKKAGLNYIGPGRPSLTFFRSLTPDDIQQISYLAMEVYNEQSKSLE